MKTEIKNGDEAFGLEVARYYLNIIRESINKENKDSIIVCLDSIKDSNQKIFNESLKKIKEEKVTHALKVLNGLVASDEIYVESENYSDVYNAMKEVDAQFFLNKTNGVLIYPSTNTVFPQFTEEKLKSFKDTLSNKIKEIIKVESDKLKIFDPSPSKNPPFFCL